MNRRAFTLIELVVVIMLLGIILLMAIPAATHMGSEERVSATAQELRATLDQAQAMAALYRRKYGLLYQLDERPQRFALLVPAKVESREQAEDRRRRAADRDDPGKTVLEALYPRDLYDDVEFYDVQVGPDETYTRGEVAIEYNPNGLTIGHVCNVGAVDDRALVFSVEVHPITGFAHVRRGYHEYEALEEAR